MKHASNQVVNNQSLKSRKLSLLLMLILVGGVTFSSCDSNSGYKDSDTVAKEAPLRDSWRAKRLTDGTIVVKKMPSGYQAGDTIQHYGKYVLLNKVSDTAK